MMGITASFALKLICVLDILEEWNSSVDFQNDDIDTNIDSSFYCISIL